MGISCPDINTDAILSCDAGSLVKIMLLCYKEKKVKKELQRCIPMTELGIKD